MYKLDGKELSLTEFVKALKELGNDAKQVAAEVALQDKDADVSDIAEKVIAEFKAIEVVAQMEATEVKEAKTDELSKSVDEAVKKALKDMPVVKAEPMKDIQRFSVVSGKTETYKTMSESRKAIADSLYYSMNHDMSSVKDVQQAVTEEMAKEYKQLGIKAPLYTDATTGSYAVATEVANEIATSRYEQSDFYKKANKQAILLNDKVYPVATDMTFATRANEATAWSDTTPSLENPTIETTEYGGLALLSKRLVELRAPEVVDMLIQAAGSADARFIDSTAAFSVTTNADAFNGLIFDSLTAGVDDITLANISADDFINLIAKLSDNVDDITFIANRKVRMKYGNLDNTAGNKLFADFMSNGNIAPMGYDFITNKKIPSTLTINASSGGTNDRASGTSDCLIAADLSKLYIATGIMRIDYSEHYKFGEDQIAWKFVNRIGSDVVTDSGNAAAAVLELTN